MENNVPQPKKPIDYKTMAFYLKIPFGILMFIAAFLIYFIYVPLRLFVKGFAHLLLGIGSLFRRKGEHEESGFVRFLRFLGATNHYKGRSRILLFIDQHVIVSEKEEMPFYVKIPFTIFVIFAAIFLDFIYVPIRFIIKIISNLVLAVYGAIQNHFLPWCAKILHSNRKDLKKGHHKFKRYRRDLHDDDDPGILLFFEYLTNHHPYKGDDEMIRYFDNHVVGASKKAQDDRVFMYFLLPALMAFLIIVIYPFFFGIYLSLTDWSFTYENINYIGFTNYAKIFTDHLYIFNFIRTIQFALISIVILNLLAFSLALLATQKLKLKNLFRAGFFMPNLIGGLILGYIWKFIFNNVIFQLTPMRSLTFLTDSSTAMGALIAVYMWQYAGYIMMIYIAALQNVPMDLIEASKIDGAGFWQRLKNITMPLITQALTVSLFLTIITSFKQFDTVYALTLGNPIGQTPQWMQTLFNIPQMSIQFLNLAALDIYKTGYTNHHMAYAQAKAVFFFLFLFIIGIGQVMITKRKEVEL
jgi:raffinose/stachyose/melibiose transport system permease protein